MSGLIDPETSDPRAYTAGMEGDFYRKPRRRRWLKDTMKKLLKNKKRMALLALGLVLVLYILFDNKGILARLRLEMKKQEMTEKVQKTEAETKQLQEQAKALEGDKKTVEKVAREKYGMAREGETVYRIKKK